MLKSYYELLDLTPDATDDEIRRAYRKKIREFHPDLNPENARAHERSRELNIALEVLTDPKKRTRYDEQLERMGKAKANAEFDAAAKSNQSDAKDDFDFEPNRKQTNTQRGQRKATNQLQPIWLLLSIGTGGIAAACVSMVFLWVFFRMDPTGLMAAEVAKSTESQEPAVDNMKELNDEIKSLRSRLAKNEGQLDQLTSAFNNNDGNENKLPTNSIKNRIVELERRLAEVPKDSGFNLAVGYQQLKQHHVISGIGVDNYEPIDLAIKPPAGRYLLFATIMAFSEESAVTDIRIQVTDGSKNVSGNYFLCFDAVNKSAGTTTIPIVVETDGTKTFQVNASRGHETQRCTIHSGSFLQYIQIAGSSMDANVEVN